MEASMRSSRIVLSAFAAVVCAAVACDRDSSSSPFGIASAADAFAMNVPSRAARATIVLVHGGFADATGWQELIPLLQQQHYPVVAVQNPLTSLDVDIATTKRLIEAQHGPVIVVGHSYGGAVITGAAAGNPNVKALVYVAAFAPDAGEPLGSLQGNYPAPPLATALVPDAAGFLYLDTAKFHDVFAQDVPLRKTRIMAVTQKPLIGSALGASTAQAAWHTIPAWYLVASEDHAINPDLERFYAKRMKAHTTEVRSSHVMFISHPIDVAKAIEDAAKSTSTQP
jgi:pimeloyl-ACP methyl ester carboxylesterase